MGQAFIIFSASASSCACVDGVYGWVSKCVGAIACNRPIKNNIRNNNNHIEQVKR